jgi:isopenicillin-N epimerase
VSQSPRDQYLLDPEIVFLNHGSFGAVPRPVFETFQRWQMEVERQPVLFFRRAEEQLAEARAAAGAFINAPADDLVFVPNATTGLNIVIRSLPLAGGDEILSTNHEYGALVKTWGLVCQKTGAIYRPHPIPLPAASHDEIVESIWTAVTPRTKVLYLSHITSPTAMILPVAELCRRARAAGIFTIIDGAHVPGHIPLDLAAIGPDAYSGNFHKWLSAPRGSAFLYVRPEHQRTIVIDGRRARLEPMTVSHGWGDETSFRQRHEWQGTRDLTAFLSVPAAIEFQRQHDWPAVRERCHALASAARRRVAELTGLPPLTPDSPDWFGQLIALAAPPFEAPRLKARLYDEYRVEIPVFPWEEHHIVRASFAAYNTHDDLERLIAALKATLLDRQ